MSEEITISKLIQNRWSPRSFAPNKDITVEQLASLFEAVRWAPSSSNVQPWSFIVGHNFDDTHKVIFSTLGEGNQIWAKNAPLLLISVTKLSRNDRPNRFAFHDVGLATENLLIQATELGLHCHAMGGFSPDKARESFNIPSDYEAVAAIAIGYMGDINLLPDDLKERQSLPRERKSLDEFVYTKTWGNPVVW